MHGKLLKAFWMQKYNEKDFLPVSSSFFRFWVEETGRNPFLKDGRKAEKNAVKHASEET